MALEGALRVRLRTDQQQLLEEWKASTGQSMPELVRNLIDEHFGVRRRTEQLQPPLVPKEPLVRQVSPPAGKNDQGRQRGVESDEQIGVTPPPTGWAGRTVQVRQGVSGSAARCRCPSETPLDGQVCTGCWMIR